MPNQSPTKLLDPELRRLRAVMLIERRVMRAMSIPAIAEEFHVSERTVVKEINWAKRQNLVADYEDQLLDDLVPAAIKTFKAALANGDAQVALEVLKGVGLLRKPTDKPMTAPAQQEDSLEIHIKRIRGTTSLPAAAASSIDVRGFLEGATLGPEDAPQSVGASGNETHDALPGAVVGTPADPAGLPFELTAEVDSPPARPAR